VARPGPVNRIGPFYLEGKEAEEIKKVKEERPFSGAAV
jgi:hypothetical protein